MERCQKGSMGIMISQVTNKEFLYEITMNRIFELKTSIERYYANQVSVVPSQGYGAIFSIIKTMSYSSNIFDAVFYNNQQGGDVEMNGWTFSNRINGHYRTYNQMPADSPEFTIMALDPLQHQWQLEVHTNGFFKEAAADFMNTITMISKFPNREIANAYYCIKQNGGDFESSEFMNCLKEIRDYYHSSYEEGTDEFFWDQVKTTYNSVIEEYKESIDALKL